MKPLFESSVHTRVHLDGEESIAAFLVVPSEIPPLPSEDRGVFFWCSIKHFQEAARLDIVRPFRKMLKTRTIALKAGRGYIEKSECKKDWKAFVKHGWARESFNRIHFIKLKEENNGVNVAVDGRMLDLCPLVHAFLVLQAYYLRMLSISSISKARASAKMRLRKNRHYGGVCLEAMGRMFNHTKQWAASMRKKLVKQGLCSYHRRLMAADMENGVSEFMYQNHKYHVWGGKGFRRLTDLCEQHEEVLFRGVFAGRGQDAYAAAKGRVNR